MSLGERKNKTSLDSLYLCFKSFVTHTGVFYPAARTLTIPNSSVFEILALTCEHVIRRPKKQEIGNGASS